MLTSSLTNSQAAVVGGVLGGMLGVFVIAMLVFYVLTVIAGWKIFEKAGEKGWKALIPIYNLYIMYKIVGMTGWFWATIIVAVIASVIMTANSAPNVYVATTDEILAYNFFASPLVIIALVAEIVVTAVASILYSWRLSKVFGHGVGYFIGLIFLPNIFWLILGFDKSKYNKKMFKR